MNTINIGLTKRFKKRAIYALIAASCVPTVANAALEEIIVTANKRAESANDIGFSIQAISGEKLTDQKLTSLEEIISIVPGLTFATSQQGTPIFTLRGVGFNESSLGVYPAVSLYTDEIPLPFPVMARHSAFDLERVEVLKGPQGVLFGQNSTGGAINFIAAKPTDEFSYGGDVSYGRFDKIEVNAFVSGALSDNVQARLAIQTVNADAWQKSNTRNDENGEEEFTAARLTVAWQPTDTTDITFNLNGWEDKSEPTAFQVVAISPKALGGAGVPERIALQNQQPFTKENPRAADWNMAQEGDREFYQTSLRGDFQLKESMTLTAFMAYSDYEQNESKDGDGYALETADFKSNVGEADSTFVEVRLAGETDRVKWVVGVNYEDSSTFEDQFLTLVDNTSARQQVGYTHNSDVDLTQDIESYAAFANVDFDLNEQVKLKAGVRYTDTEISARNCAKAPPNDSRVGTDFRGVGVGYLPDFSAFGLTPLVASDDGSNISTFFNLLTSAFSGLVPSDNPGAGEFQALSTLGCNSLDNEGFPGTPFEDTLAEDNVSWRLGVDYQATDNIMVYGNVSKGYKTGTFPTIPGLNWDEIQPVTQEEVLSYEVGFKASLADNRIQWNTAVFKLDYTDKQVRGKKDIFPFGPLDALVNVDESTIEGIETELVAQLTDELTLNLAATFIESEIDEFVGFDSYGVFRDLSGNDIPLTPELTYSLGLDYRKTLESGGTLLAGVSLTGQSESDAVFDADDLTLDDYLGGASPSRVSLLDNYLVVDEFWTTNARVGYESADGRWRVMLWGKNITDEYYWNNVLTTSETGARVAGRPRTYGITVGYKY